MGNLADALANVLETFGSLTVDGHPVRAYGDSAQVNPPCVYVPIPDIDFRFSKRCLEVTWVAYVCGSNQTTESVAPPLSALVDAVAGLFPFTTGRAYTLTLPGGGVPLPAYQLTWSDRIPLGGN